MKYQEYIDLGFKRTDINDEVVRKQTGYSGYFLIKKITNRISIEVNFGELDKPILFILKPDLVHCHRIPITDEIVRDLFSSKQDSVYIQAC